MNTVLMQVVSNFEVDHRAMAESFLRQQGFAVNAEPAMISAVREVDGAEVRLAFDAQQRIAKVEGVIKPRESKGPWWKPWWARLNRCDYWDSLPYRQYFRSVAE